MANEAPVNPWLAAFEALEPKGEETAEADADTGGDVAGGVGADAEGSDGKDATEDESGLGESNEDSAGGLDTPAGADAGEGGVGSGSAFQNATGVTEESVQQFEDNLNETIRNQAIEEVAAEFIRRGVRNHNGVLGATLDDADICKRDEDGVPHFYNPETGQEFRGDNPRRQAKEWVDDYNNELSRVFNNTCEEYENHLKKESAPRIAVMKFAPKYEKLDDIRKGMFDNVIQDYEIKDDNGDTIGYSCDLDKALALVERQVEMIRNYAKQHQQQPQQQPSGPALDMKTSSGAVPNGNKTQPKSLAEAMEFLQDQQLAKLNKN